MFSLWFFLILLMAICHSYNYESKYIFQFLRGLEIKPLLTPEINFSVMGFRHDSSWNWNWSKLENLDLLEGHICSCKLKKNLLTYWNHPLQILRLILYKSVQILPFIFIVPFLRDNIFKHFLSFSRHKDFWCYCSQVWWDDIQCLLPDCVFFRNKTSVVHILIYHLSLSQAFPHPYFIFYYFPLPLFFLILLNNVLSSLNFFI